MSKYFDNPNNVNENNINNAGTPIDDGSGYKKPTNLLNALSVIQRLFVIETRTDEDLPSEYFTIEQIWDFFKVGFKSGFLESLIFITLLPFLQTIYPSFKYFFFHEKLNENELLILQTISFLPIIFSTIYLVYLSKYYKGNITRRALISLFTGRSFAFLIKGIIIFLMFKWFYYISYEYPEKVWDLIDFMRWIINLFLPYNIDNNIVYNYYFTFIAPALEKTAKEILVTMFFFALLPYITIFLKGFTKYSKIKRARKYFDNY